jgi:uncharacterized protein YndB with AHSA1/START domain
VVPDRIEKEIVIDAPVDVVWAIVTEPEHVGSWFSDSAEIDLRPGGKAALTWTDHGTAFGWVEEVEPPTRFAIRWARPLGAEPRPENTTLVEFILTEESEGTRLSVVESGFRALEGSDEEKAEYAKGNEQGWEHELGELVEYVATQPARG